MYYILLSFVECAPRPYHGGFTLLLVPNFMWKAWTWVWWPRAAIGILLATRWPLLTGQNVTGQSFAFQWGWEMFLASRFDPFSGEFLLIVLHELAGPYPSILLGFAGYFWAQSLGYQFLSFKNVAFFVFLRTTISSFTPLCFHLVLKRAPRFLSPVRHVDLSQGRARKASWSMAVFCHCQKFFNFF